MKRLELKPEAEADLLGIWVYIARETEPLTADSVLDRVAETLNLLATTPELGRARPELGSDLRSFAARRYAIFYRITAETVEIVRVLDGAQDIPSVMRSDPLS